MQCKVWDLSILPSYPSRCSINYHLVLGSLPWSVPLAILSISFSKPDFLSWDMVHNHKLLTWIYSAGPICVTRHPLEMDTFPLLWDSSLVQWQTPPGEHCCGMSLGKVFSANLPSVAKRTNSCCHRWVDHQCHHLGLEHPCLRNMDQIFHPFLNRQHCFYCCLCCLCYWFYCLQCRICRQ